MSSTEMPRITPLRRSLPFLRPYSGRILFALACLTIAALAALAMPVSIRLVVDHGFSGENTQSLDIYFVALLMLSLIYALSSSLRYYTVMWIGERVVADIRSAVYEHVIKMDPTFFEVTKSGEVLSRLTTDTTLVQSVVGAGVSIALRSSFILAGGLIMLFVTSSRLSMLLFGLLPVVVLPVWYYGRKVRKLSRETQDRVADSSGIAGEVLNAIHIVQAFTMEPLQSRRFGDAVERSFQAARRRLSVGALLSGLIVLTAFSRHRHRVVDRRPFRHRRQYLRRHTGTVPVLCNTGRRQHVGAGGGLERRAARGRSHGKADEYT